MIGMNRCKSNTEREFIDKHFTFEENFEYFGHKLRLLAVVEFKEGITSRNKEAGVAHYIAHCVRVTKAGKRQQRKWYTFDDDSVIPSSWEKVRCTNAYILFYENQYSECLTPG